MATLIAIAGGPSHAQQADGTGAATPPRHAPLEETIGVARTTGPVPSLAMMNADGATLEGGKLTLTGVSANTTVFADRPVRAAGHVVTEQFIMQCY